MRTKWAALIGLLLAASALAAAQGGPPLRTDDPGTPGNENWEINAGVITELRSAEHQFEAPNLDINYGLGDRIQLKYELPWLVLDPGQQPARQGLGNSLAGVKWRFYDNEKRRLWISTYPQIAFNNPNRSVQRGLAERGPAFLLPVEIAKDLGPVTLNAEVGHWFSRDDPQWIAGLAAGRQATQRLELLAEVYHVTARLPSERDTSFDLGGRLKLTRMAQLIFAAGRSFRGPSSGRPQFLAYVGMQFLLLDAWEAEDHPVKTKRP